MKDASTAAETQGAPTFELRQRALQERVSEVAKALLERGVRPTVARVRSALGGGSPNDLAPALRHWKESISPAMLRSSGGISAEPSALPLQIADLVHELWQRAMAAAVVEARGGSTARDLAARAGEAQVLRAQVTTLRDQLQRESLAYGEMRAQAARHEAIARTALARADASELRERDLLRQTGVLQQKVGELKALLERLEESRASREAKAKTPRGRAPRQLKSKQIVRNPTARKGRKGRVSAKAPRAAAQRRSSKRKR